MGLMGATGHGRARRARRPDCSSRNKDSWDGNGADRPGRPLAGPLEAAGTNGTNELNGARGPGRPPRRSDRSSRNERNKWNEWRTGPVGPAGRQVQQERMRLNGTNGTNGTNGVTGPTGPVGCASANYIIKSNGTNATCTVAPIYEDATGKVGIGVTTPVAKLDILGNVKIADGTQGLAKVLTSDATGLASWQPIYGNNAHSVKLATIQRYNQYSLC